MKADTDFGFDRLLLKDAVADAKRMGAVPKDAWVHATCGQFEFHYRGFYWNGKAGSKWHARALGWEAWGRQQEAVQAVTSKEVNA